MDVFKIALVSDKSMFKNSSRKLDVHGKSLRIISELTETTCQDGQPIQKEETSERSKTHQGARFFGVIKAKDISP